MHVRGVVARLGRTVRAVAEAEGLLHWGWGCLPGLEGELAEVAVGEVGGEEPSVRHNPHELLQRPLVRQLKVPHVGSPNAPQHHDAPPVATHVVVGEVAHAGLPDGYREGAGLEGCHKCLTGLLQLAEGGLCGIC